MIQLWLAKNAVNLGIVGAIVLAIFFSGFYVKGKMVKRKIEKLNVELENTTYNYNQALESNERCVAGLGSLESAIVEGNKAIEKLAKDSQAALDRANRMHQIALDNERRQNAAAMAQAQDDYLALQEKWSALSAPAACHEAWLEVVQ